MAKEKDGGNDKKAGEFVETPADKMTGDKPYRVIGRSHAPKKTFAPWDLSTQDPVDGFFHRPPKDATKLPSHMPQNPMNLQLHLHSDRRRALGMTAEEEEWRKKWVLDQKLHPDEPVYVEGAVRHLNPIRRFYRYPLDTFEQRVLIPSLGLKAGHAIRTIVPKFFLGLVGGIFAYSYYKYNRPTWMDRARGYHILPRAYIFDEARIEKTHPGLMDKAFPLPTEEKDFYDLKFYRRTTHLDVGPPTRPW